ncbi:WD40 repeat domain-containing protein [Pseudoalteromonas sp. MTN2-4]|uniref:WD40 repeat domain-containing protein n=1 Tax=Pseudoalteromonas sp. MTN2-4 TaxID=3056555 RepID=UPI0036F237DF
MYASKKIDSFRTNTNEQFIFATNFDGEVECIDINTFEHINSIKGHVGSIHTVAVHRTLNYVATCGMDNRITVYEYDESGVLSIVDSISVTEVVPEGEEWDKVITTSQAIDFHPTKKVLAARGGTSGLVEVSFETGKCEILHCSRLHDFWDLITVQYVHDGSGRLLSASNRGDIILSESGVAINKWNIHEQLRPHSTHWIEHVAGSTYAIANDALKVITIDIDDLEKTMIGPENVVLDHLEHLTYNPVSDRMFVSSFDRTVVEVDRYSGEKVKVAFEAPFKCRWLKSLQTNPNHLIVQCRNGALYKVDIDTHEVIATVKRTPDAIWTGFMQNGTVFLSGEGDYFYTLKATGQEYGSRVTQFDIESTSIFKNGQSYTKRLQSDGNVVAFARTNNVLYTYNLASKSVTDIELTSAIRDIELFEEGEKFLACCEDGNVYLGNTDGSSKEKIFTSSTSVWSVSLNKEKGLIAMADRKDRVHFLNMNTGEITHFEYLSEYGSKYIKRIQWVSEDELLVALGGDLIKYRLSTNKATEHFRAPNTIEDFAWDKNKRFLIVMSYTRFIYLCDFDSGRLLHTAGASIDYTKGLCFINGEDDFISFGRDGVPYYHRIHDERIVTHGVINNFKPKF